MKNNKYSILEWIAAVLIIMAICYISFQMKMLEFKILQYLNQ